MKLMKRGHKGRIYRTGFILILILYLFNGCRSTDWKAVRIEESERFTSEMQDKTWLYQDKYPKGLTLADCWEIASEESLSLRVQDLNREISRLERHVAFASFLPVIEIEWDYTSWNKQPAADVRDLTPLLPFDSIPLHDKRIRNTTVSAHVPIFVPKTWFLYSARRRGEEIQNLVYELMEQVVFLQIVSQYYHCLSLEQSLNVLQGQMEAAQVLHKEAVSWLAEDLILPWELMEIKLLVQDKERALRQSQRRIEEAYSELWITLGLSPDAQFYLKEPDFDITQPEDPEDLIIKALINNPRMHISDREIAIQEDRARIAVSIFLPEVMGFARYQSTSNELARHSTNYLWGAAGVLSVFNGFANINQYKIARKESERSYLEREEAALGLMLQVIKGYNRLQDSLENRDVARKNLDLQESRLKTKQAEFTQGLITLSDLLKSQASRDRAKMMYLNNRYQVQVSQSMLDYLTGDSVEIQIKRGN